MSSRSPPRPLTPLFLVTLLLSASLAAAFAGDAGAQDPTTVSPEDNILTVQDRVGDPGPLGVSVSQAPIPEVLDHIDIATFTIGPETIDAFSFGIRFVGWDPVASRAMETAAVSKMRCRIEWSYDSEVDVRYVLHMAGDYSVPGESGPTFWSELNYQHWGERSSQWDWTSEGFTVGYDVSTTTLSVTLPKALVPVFPGARAAGDGDELEVRSVYCRTDTARTVSFYDFLDESDARYRFRSAGAGDVVRISVGSGSPGAASGDAADWQFPRGNTGSGTATVQADGPSLVAVHLENRAPERKLVLLSVTPQDEATGWNLSIAPSVFLKGGERRSVNLIATPPPGVALGATIEGEVRAELAAEDGVGVAPLRLKVAPQLSQEHNRVYLHARAEDPGGLRPLSEATGNSDYDIRMSLLTEEPTYDATIVDPGPLHEIWDSSILDPIGRPVRLLVEEDARLQVKIDGEEGASQMVYISVATRLADEYTRLYYVYTSLAVGTHTLDLPARFDEDLDLPAGTVLEFYLYTYRSDAVLASGIVPRETHITLPIESTKAGLNVTDGRFLPNLAFAAGEERTTYVNPGKEYAFDLNLSNDGIEEDVVQVTASAVNGTGWTVRLQPGARFRIAPGESTPLSVSVVAPQDAKEGDAVEVLVKATSRNDEGASSSVELRAVATEGVDLEAKPYTEKEDQIAPLVDEEGSPSASVLLTMLALLGVVAVLRRRRP